MIYASLTGLGTYSSIAVTYGNTDSRAIVKDNLCNYSFAGADASGNPVALTAARLAAFYATGNGVPPGSGAQFINNASIGGAKRSILSVSPSTGRTDYNLDGSRCLRGLLTTSTTPQASIAETYLAGRAARLRLALRAAAPVPAAANAITVSGTTVSVPK